MKIVISGGWGYGNIGDDAILDSTIKLLRSMYMDAEIVVLTYSKKDSFPHLKTGIRLEKSAHSILDCGASEAAYKIINKSYSFVDKVILKARYLFSEKFIKWVKFFKNKEFGMLVDEISSADMYVVGGGGYMNNIWKSKVNSMIIELNIAKKYSVDVIVLGPTIGHLSPSIEHDLKNALSGSKLNIVRDEKSKRIFEKSKVFPDIALGYWVGDGGSNGDVGLIYNGFNKGYNKSVAEKISKYCQISGKKVKIIISRKWSNDFGSAMVLQDLLIENNISSAIFLPADHDELEGCISSCEVVFSENLHGLILAARNCVPFVAINNYKSDSPNDRKFNAFLEQCGLEEMCFGERYHVSDDHIVNVIRSGEVIKKLDLFRRGVNKIYSNEIRSIC